MKKFYKYFGLALIMVFSFYYTEQISQIVLNKNPLMVRIVEKSPEYNVKSVNAIVTGDYITPGINGLKVNKRESFYEMQKLDAFNEYYLVFDQIKPDVSLDNNKEKIIISGNPKLQQISLILEEENDISDYLKENSLKASLLVNLDTYKSENYFEVINNEVNGFKSLDNNLDLNKENKNICVLNDYNKEQCVKYKKYLVSPTLNLNSNNLSQVKSNLKNGSIILIKANAKLSDVKFLLKEIKYKGLEIVYLSEIISEENNCN